MHDVNGAWCAVLIQILHNEKVIFREHRCHIWLVATLDDLPRSRCCLQVACECVTQQLVEWIVWLKSSTWELSDQSDTYVDFGGWWRKQCFLGLQPNMSQTECRSQSNHAKLVECCNQTCLESFVQKHIMYHNKCRIHVFSSYTNGCTFFCIIAYHLLGQRWFFV